MALVRYTPRSTFVPWPELDLFSNRLSRVFGNAWDTPEFTGAWIPAVNVEEAADELLRWVFCNGRRLRGLELRRTDERALFLA